MKKTTTALLLAIMLTAGASAQQRAAHYGGTKRMVTPIERSEAANRTVRNFAPTYQRGLRTPQQPVDVSAISASYTKTPPMRVLGDGTTIYGSIIYADSWVQSGAAYGLYSFKADATPGVNLVHSVTGGYLANGGGCYADGKYYFNSYVYTEEMGYTFSTFITMDVATGEMKKNTQSFIQGTFDQSQITHDMTYDPTTGTIYASAYIKETLDEEGLFERFSTAISTVDTYTGFVTPIAKTPGFIAIAANNSGELYGITKGSRSALYRVNKTTGECTEIGPTGLNPEYVQSAAFDPVTDKLYWAETEYNGTSGLYEVNLTTGKAEKIASFADNEEFTGIYIPAPTVAAAAPAAVTAQGAVFAGASLSGKLTFTAPTLSYGGAELSGELVAEVRLDGEDYATLDVTPGQEVSVDATLTEGAHGFTVFVSNEAGEGPRTGYSWYVGIDGPAAVGDLTLSSNALDEPVISWTAPTVGRNGGYIDPAQLTYKVVRQPEAVTVAENIRTTTFTDKGKFKAQQVFYTVQAFCAGREGAEASTAEGLYGTGSELPVTWTFDTEDDFKLCTAIDANGDADTQYHWGYWLYSPTFSYTEKYDAAAAYVFGQEVADDWLFMPPFTAEQGKLYRVTFRTINTGSPERLAVTAGPAAAIASQTVILPANNYNNKEYATYTADFRASASGNYYVGFHCTSAKKAGYLLIDDVCVDEIPDTSAPAAVGSLTVTADPSGALKATVAFTAPTTNAAGSALDALTRIDIFRGNDNTVLHSFAAPVKGAALSWTDNDAIEGINTYRVVAYNASGAGEKAMASTYVGYDLPTAVTELTLVEEGGHPVLRWVAPEFGQNDGYLNPDELVYRIIRSDNTIMSSNATDTEFIDYSLDGSAHQYFIYYQVQAVSKAGIGDYALSNHIIYGDPYEGEFFESFDDAALSTDPWMLYRIKGNQQLWTILSQGQSPACYDADMSGGLAAFQSGNGYMNDEGRLVSPKLRIDNMDVPTFSFAFYHCPDQGTIAGDEPYTDRMVPEVCLPDGSYVALDSPIYVDDPTWDEGWYLYVYDLSEYKNHGYVQLSFHGYAGYANDVYVDYITLENNNEYDLVAYTFSGPNGVKVGRTARYTYTVLNQGMKAADAYTVKLMCNGKELQSQPSTAALYPGKTATYTFEVPATLADEGKVLTYYATAEFAQDDVPNNNASGTISTRVLSPDVPEVRTLSAELKGADKVALAWGDADALHVNDDFENYAAFSIADIGDYTLIDGDKNPVFTFSDIDFPNSGEPVAFMVFNPVMLGVAPALPEWTPASGSQVLAAFSPHDGSGTATTADDWLISPEIHGGTISFKAKTANWEWGMENFEVMYSTTDAAKASFVSLTGKLEAPKDWTELSYTLPANAKYFAIHYVTNDGFIFYLDDLCYTAKCAIEGEALAGFRIYRDGRAIADAGVADRSFTDSGVADGLHTYGVSALFGSRESLPVQLAVQVGESGLDDVATTDLSIRAEASCIAIDGASGLDVAVTNAAGMTVFASAAADAYRVTVTPGVYVVRAGTTVEKLLVK
ncbi:MAG: choice-of-anchor J domain-containing protein [Muribaculaceae bacterium]|nr:choice-of-anchor J domain-containing protein [Muribaculaceae bacterium]